MANDPAAAPKRPSSSKLLLALLIALWSILGPAPSGIAGGAVPMAIDGNASAVSEIQVTLSAGVPVSFETRDLSPGSDPVLNLVLNGRGVASDNDGGGGWAARLTYTPTTSGLYLLIVHAHIPSRKGTADIFKDGSLLRSQVPFAGWKILLSDLRASEVVETVKLPNGAGGRHSLYILKGDAIGVEAGSSGGGIAQGARYTVKANIGSHWVIVGTSGTQLEGRPVRLVRNDANLSGHDPDQDGLGTELEDALGTCSSLAGVVGTEPSFDCSLATDPRDTDGDGISDAWEAIGRHHVYQRSSRVLVHTHLPLPMWGANPRHKDLFVEVDFMLRQPGETPQKLSPAAAREFASYYQDEVGSISEERKSLHATTLRNPDGLPGINVHLDIGTPPENPEDATLYGDWGGYTAVPPVETSDGTWVGAEYSNAWKTYMNRARYGIFRYALPYSSGGGQTGINYFAFTGSLNGTLLAHESGHGMGLAHAGPAGATGDVDPNCKPNYPSLMNYAYLWDRSVGFSDGLNPPLNNASLVEWNAILPSNTPSLGALERVFRYGVDRNHGHVDWNRDGSIAPRGTRVRAYANFAPGSGCEYTRYNQARIPEATSTQTPALARLGNRLYVFYSELGTLRYLHSTSSWNCPAPEKEGCGNETWTPSEEAFLDASGGVDVVRIGGYGADSQLLVVAIDGQGRLWEARLSLNSLGQEVWTAPSLIPGSTSAAGQPSLEAIDTGAYLVYKGADGLIRFNRMTVAQGWFGEQLALTPGGAAIPTATYSSPAIARAYLPWMPGTPALYGAFPNGSGYLEIWLFDGGTGRWEKTDVLDGPSTRVEGRPAMAWVPARGDAEYPGRFYLMYVKHDPATVGQKWRTVQMLQSYFDGAQMRERVGLVSPFDNGWYLAFGIDLLYESGIDTNLRAVVANAIDHPDLLGTLWLRPKADGINDFTYTDYDDWEVLRIGLCRNVVNPTKLVSNPIRCPVATNDDQPVPVGSRIGIVETGNHAWVREGPLGSESWTWLGDAQQIVVSGDRIGIIDAGRPWVRQGPVGNDGWIQVSPATVRQIDLSGDRIAILAADGTPWVREGLLGDHSWVRVSTTTVDQIALAGDRIGILAADGTPWVREGPLGDHSWVRVSTTTVNQIALAGDRIGILAADGTPWVREGPLGDHSWVRVSTTTVNQIALAGDRIGILAADGTPWVREGPLGDHSWVKVSTTTVNQIALAGDRIGIVDAADKPWVREGPLDDHSWVQVSTTSVTQLDLDRE